MLYQQQKNLTTRALKNLKRNHANCPTCQGKKIVGGDGSYSLPVMIVGEAPGYQENETGKPFVGKAGKLLRSELLRAGLNPVRFYLTNTVKSFPNGTPTDEEAVACASCYLSKEIEILQPRWVLALGRIAFQTLTGTDEKITPARGKMYDTHYGEALVLPTFHPSYILRGGKNAHSLFRHDLKTFAAILEIDL